MRFSTQSAFTLIELMLALVISAVLLALAAPLFENNVAEVQRNRAEVALLQLSAKLENYFSENGTYVGATIENVGANKLMNGLQYTLSIFSSDDNSFQVQAVPQNAQASRDAQCGSLMVDEKNERSISGGGDATQCWQ